MVSQPSRVTGVDPRSRTGWEMNLYQSIGTDLPYLESRGDDLIVL